MNTTTVVRSYTPLLDTLAAIVAEYSALGWCDDVAEFLEKHAQQTDQIHMFPKDPPHHLMKQYITLTRKSAGWFASGRSHLHVKKDVIIPGLGKEGELVPSWRRLAEQMACVILATTKPSMVYKIMDCTVDFPSIDHDVYNWPVLYFPKAAYDFTERRIWDS